MPQFEEVRNGYTNLWDKAKVNPARKDELLALWRRMKVNRPAYIELGDALGGIPWWFIAFLHYRESNLDFSKHLHNGDPLSARTVREPPGRPAVGKPPFNFYDSAIDALRLKRFDEVIDWSIPHALFLAEKYNGFGYYSTGINSPYVWSGTDLYSSGKFYEDHKFSPNVVDKQLGLAGVLKIARSIGELDLTPPQENPMSEIKAALTPFVALGPTLLTALAGPTAGLVIKALSQTLPGEVSQDEKGVAKALQDAPFSDLVSAITSAEKLLKSVLQTEQPLPAPPPPPAPISNVDTMFGGKFLSGWKTIIGIVGMVAVYILGKQAILPELLTPSLLDSMWAFFGGLTGLGVLAKFERGDINKFLGR